MMVLSRVVAAALFAFAVFFSVSAKASVTYVFIASSLQMSHGENPQVPMPLSAPMGRLTITDEAFAERKIDSRLDVLDFYFNVPAPAPVFFGIDNTPQCQAPTVTFRCSLAAVPISMMLSEDGEIESGFISYYGGSIYGHFYEYFDNDRILVMQGRDGEWDGRHIGEAGACGQGPGCLFTGEWVPIPEPASAALLTSALGAILWLRRHRSAPGL